MRFILVLCILAIISSTEIKGQAKKLKYRKKTFQVSLFPGISSNGIYSARFQNKFSLNLISGISAGNQYLEIGGISNLSTVSSTGIMLAGMANIVGTNSFINLTSGEERELKMDGFSSDIRGIQVAGLLNYTRNNMMGIQVTGGINMNDGISEGFQLAGLGNMVGGTLLGVQLSGVYNIALDGAFGVQVSPLFNYTKGELAGLQIGAINKSKKMSGKHSQPETKVRSMQIGLVNIGGKVGGTQIGLINIGKEVRGYQIGLINIFSSAVPKEYGPYNTPVGLLNLGSKGTHVRITSNELFLMETEITTGSCYNCSKTELEMPFDDKWKKMNQNAIILGFMPHENTTKWGIGYGFRRVLYKKGAMIRIRRQEAAGQGNLSKIISMGYSIIQLNEDKQFNRSLNVVNRLHMEVGKRMFGFYLIGGLSLNAHITKSTPVNEGLKFLKIDQNELKYRFWPGYTIGIQL